MPNYKKLVRRKSSSRRIITQSRKANKPLAGRALTLVFSLGLIAVLMIGGRILLTSLNSFNIKGLAVINVKGEPVTHPESYFRLENNGKLNLFSFDVERVADDIRARHPELSSVLVRKRFPNQLVIIIKEKQPVAILAIGAPCLTDREGFILPLKNGYSNLPKITGLNPRDIRLYQQSESLRLTRALDVLNELQKAKVYPQYNITRIDISNYQDLTFYLKGGTEVRMGEGEFSQKAALLKGVLGQLKKEKTVPQYIDLRFGNPTVMP